MNNEIDIHIMGMQRLKAIDANGLANSDTKKLSKEITKLCRNSGLSYLEIQKAIVYADNSLYYRAKVNSNA
ncbi:hypothetical protein K3F51_05040 [Limosilactobacillus reuteri]|uniref:hypothetical protein n=1 Tax=Limosilactobacillus reuteri TaxID=1598 RepID=UPI0010508F86|nr:hypothetical protein [Limosilactobacillus reuteri]UAW61280.1 hypothetical protein K3F51_05040 [Limosilactobacillus reuteri]